MQKIDMRNHDSAIMTESTADEFVCTIIGKYNKTKWRLTARFRTINARTFHADFVHLALFIEINNEILKLKYNHCVLSSEVLMTFCHKFVLEKMLENVVQHR